MQKQTYLNYLTAPLQDWSIFLIELYFFSKVRNSTQIEAVSELVDYLYTSRLKITQNTARDLLSVACRLELASAQNALELYLKTRMTVPLAIQTLKVHF